MIGYGDRATPSLMRRQHTDNSPNSSHAVIAEIGYSYIINDHWTLSLYLDQRHDRNSKESSFYMAQAEADATGDFTIYKRSGYDSPQLNTTDLVWNMRLSKTFSKGRWTVAVDGFDLLHQLTNVRYSVSPSGRIESYSNTLPRYVLLHAQYKLNIKPKKKELTGKTYTY